MQGKHYMYAMQTCKTASSYKTSYLIKVNTVTYIQVLNYYSAMTWLALFQSRLLLTLADYASIARMGARMLSQM